MKLYVLDTDATGFVQSEHPIVSGRINTLPDDDTVVTTVVTFGEDLSGSSARLPTCARRAGTRPSL